MRRVFDKVHTAAKLDIDLANQVNSDVVRYTNSTEGPREELREDIQHWKEEG